MGRVDRMIRGAMVIVVASLAACAAGQPHASVNDAPPDSTAPDPCPEDFWRSLAEDGRSGVLVNAEAGAGGDGSEARPFDTIQAGADAAAASGGGWVWVEAGEYMGQVVLGKEHDGVDIVGRCSSLVSLDAKGIKDAAFAVVGGGRVTPSVGVRGVSLTGPYSGIYVEHAALTARDVNVANVEGVGLIGYLGADISLTDVDILDTSAYRGIGGFGVQVDSHTTLVGERVAVVGSQGVGVLVGAGESTISLTDSRIEATRPSQDGTGGNGCTAQDGGTLEFVNTAITGNTRMGVYAVKSGSTVRLSGGEISDTLPAPDNTLGRGIAAWDGARVEADGLAVADNVDVGIFAANPDTVVELHNVLVSGTRALPGQPTSAGIAVEDGAVLTASDLTLVGNQSVGLLAGLSRPHVTLERVEVRDTVPGSDGLYGRGIAVGDTAVLVAHDVRVDGAPQHGVMVIGVGTSAELTDVVVERVYPDATGALGRGIEVNDGATLVADHVWVGGCSDAGIMVGGIGTEATLRNVRVTDTAENDGSSGTAGIAVSDGAAATISDAVLVGNAAAGIHARGAGTQVSLKDTSISRGVRAVGVGYGAGLIVGTGATVVASHIGIRESDLLAVGVIGASAWLTLSDVTVEGTTAPGKHGQGTAIQVSDGGRLDAERLTVLDGAVCGLIASGADTTVALTDVSITRTSNLGEPPDDQTWGRGMQVEAGAVVSGERVAIVDSVSVGLHASGSGTSVELRDVALQHIARGAGSTIALAVSVDSLADVRLTDATISDAAGIGLFASVGGRLACTRCTVRDNSFAGGAVVGGGDLRLLSSSVADTEPDAELGGGIGLYASDVYGAPTLIVTDSDVGPHPYAAIWLDGNGRYEISDSDLAAGPSVPNRAWSHGNAVFATNGVLPLTGDIGLLLARNQIHGAAEIGVLLNDSGATFANNVWSGNNVDARQQGCDVSGEVDLSAEVGISSTHLCSGGDTLWDNSLRFDGLYITESEPRSE